MDEPSHLFPKSQSGENDHKKEREGVGGAVKYVIVAAIMLWHTPRILSRYRRPEEGGSCSLFSYLDKTN